MTTIVLVHNANEWVLGRIVSHMAYGAIVNYTSGGIEFSEMLSDEDYEVLFDLDDVMKELEDCE